MTLINKLVMQGFKSFAKRTEVTFDEKFNCVVGPNGSGKSNVIDAICFVLGKGSAKGLRAEKASNLVYDGGKNKKPAKEGRVSIYFDNSNGTFPSEEKEVKITRIVQQNGTSKYKINDKARTRQQVLDTLAIAKINPDGYNIILQGDIVKFVEMSPNDKRKLIEEVAGISVFDEKKEKASKELEKVEGKLGEADIVLKERKSYLNDLKSERDQALKYRELTDKIRTNKASYLKIKIDRLEQQKGDADKRIEQHKQAISDYDTKIKEYKDAIEAKRKEVREISHEVEVKGEKEQVDLQKEIEQMRVDIATLKTRITSHEQEISRIQQRREQLKQSLEELNKKISEQEEEKEKLEKRKERRENEKADIDKKIADFKKKHKLDDNTEELEQQIDGYDKEAEQIQTEIQQLKERQQEVLRQQDRVEYEIQTIDERIEKMQEVEKQHKEELEQLQNKRKRFKTVTLELNKKLDQSSSIAAEINRLESELQQAREQYAKLEAKNATIKEKAAGNMAVQTLLEKKKEFPGLYGTVAELGSVSSTYSQALEAAAGPRLKSLVVKDDATASTCINYLKKHRLGTATFLPLNKLKSVNEDAGTFAKAKGVHGRALDLISYDAKYRKAFAHVFGNTIVVENIEVARRIGVGNIRMATLSGDLSELSGAMQGGHREQKKGTAFKEEEVAAELEKKEKQVARLQEEIEKNQQARQSNDDEITRLREEKANLEGEIIKIEKGLHVDSKDLEADQNKKKELKGQAEELEKQMEDITTQVSDANKRLAKSKEEREKIKERLNQLRSPQLLAELNTFEQRKREIQEELIKIDGDLKNVNSQLDENFKKEKENTEKVIKDIDKEEEQFSKELEDYKKQLEEKENTLQEKEKKHEEFYKQFKELFARRTKLNEEITTNEKEISSLEEKRRGEEQKINQISLENAKYDAQLSSLYEEFEEYEGVDIDQEKSEEQLKKELNEQEKEKEKIGNVNLRALEIYDSVEQEYNNLLEKKDQLLREKQDVVNLIDEIEGKKKSRFMETLEEVNKHFVAMFSKLSGKGEAYLEMEDQEDPLNGGLFVRVKISGTKFMDIRSLSGGEKTLTALSFLFAMQEHEPATFYVLDEVDAALDKRNAEKLAKLISQYCQRAQYIVISHNDALINDASTLYGVSMKEDEGVSKIVSLRV